MEKIEGIDSKLVYDNETGKNIHDQLGKLSDLTTPAGSIIESINEKDQRLGNLSGNLDSVNTQLSDFVSVSTSDVAAINDIISNAALNGKLVKFINLVTVIDSSILVPDNAKIDFNNTIIQRESGSGVFDLVKNKDETNGNTNIKLSNLLLDGNKDVDGLVAGTDSHRFSGLKLTKVTNSEIRNIDVKKTVNGEEQQTNPAAGIFFVDCENIDCYDLKGSYNDRTAIFIWKSKRIRIFGSVTHDNVGSGISGTDALECEYYNIVTYNNGYSNLSVNGLRSKVAHIRSWGSAYSGVNVGHLNVPADETILHDIHSFDNNYEGLTIGGSNDVKGSDIVVYGNGILAGRDNIRVFDQSNRSKLIGVTSRDSANGAGIRYYSGKGHVLDQSEFYKNKANGVYVDIGSQVTIGSTVKAYNNGQAGGTYAGILLSQAVDCMVDKSECYDNQTTKTQAYGLWIAGGNGHRIVEANLHDNLTSDYQLNSSPSNIIRTLKPTDKVSVISGLNSWVPSFVKYYKDANGTVHIEGKFDTGIVGTVAFTLPSGYRPNRTMRFSTNANGSWAYCEITSAGNVLLFTSNLSHYLDGVSFVAMQ